MRERQPTPHLKEKLTTAIMVGLGLLGMLYLDKTNARPQAVMPSSMSPDPEYHYIVDMGQKTFTTDNPYNKTEFGDDKVHNYEDLSQVKTP